MYDVVPDPVTRHDLLCDVAARLWRPVSADVDLPTGADKAREYADLLPRLWEETGRACSEADRRGRSRMPERRRRAHDDRDAVLVHGDVHDLNALQAADGTFKLVDPAACALSERTTSAPSSDATPTAATTCTPGQSGWPPHWCGRHRDLGVGNDPPRHRRPLQPTHRVPAVRRPLARRGRSTNRMSAGALKRDRCERPGSDDDEPRRPRSRGSTRAHAAGGSSSEQFEQTIEHRTSSRIYVSRLRTAPSATSAGGVAVASYAASRRSLAWNTGHGRKLVLQARYPPQHAEQPVAAGLRDLV